MQYEYGISKPWNFLFIKEFWNCTSQLYKKNDIDKNDDEFNKNKKKSFKSK